MSLTRGVSVATVNFIKTVNGLVPATEDDREKFNRWKNGGVITGEFKQVRNPKFHRKFFALLNLAFDRYEPSGGVLTKDEKRIATLIFKTLDSHIENHGVIIDWGRDFMRRLAEKRREGAPDIEKAFDAFRREMMIEAGYYETSADPNGVVKTAKSISFASMDETEFHEFYKAMFNVLWRFVLSRDFATEQEAEQAAMKMLEFAG